MDIYEAKIGGKFSLLQANLVSQEARIREREREREKDVG